MRYEVAGIEIDLPDALLSGHFATALESFAVPFGNDPKRDGASALAAGRDTNGPAEPTGLAPNTSEAGDAPEAKNHPSAENAPDILLRQGDCAPARPDYRELDRFDFADAEADCRFGLDGDGYLLEMAPRSGAAPARFRKRSGDPVVTTDFTGAHHPALLRFGLWIAFNLAAVPQRTTAFHSSVIDYRDHGILVLGESGTGKSTHTRLWREHIRGAALLNDDSPIVRVRDEAVEVCGSPWSGKTPCYRNRTLPVAAVVRLSQAPHNRIRRLRPLEALGALLPSVPPAFARDEGLQDALCELISQVVQRVPVFHLECLPDADAARLACTTIFPTEELR